jgi:hypothetical protein
MPRLMADHQPLGFDTSGSEISDLWNDPTRLIGITETDGTTSRYVDVRLSCEQILGYTRDEILAMRPGDLVYAEGSAAREQRPPPATAPAARSLV